MSLQTYTKVRVIGKGSYGEVWLVKHKKDKKQYVLKKLELQNASKRERKAAEQEAKLLSNLRHPNIVSYKDSFQDDSGYLFIAMGFCEGGDLYGRLKEQKLKPLEERQVVEWFVQIAMALQYMHERNILHRDLKTQNIFLTKSKIIKLGDLGIARVLDSSCDMATTLIGTPYYMSPELFSNKPYNHKSDVWALGCCVYEMATLKHAFNAKDMNSLVYKILRGKMPQMPKIYSPALVQLIKAMLNQNPERRPSVNRILRDPYIKKNIAIFLEGTKKSRSRPSSSSSRRSDSAKSEDIPDSARSSASSVSSVGAAVSKAYKPRASPVVELEPLQVGPDLEVIVEEDDIKSPKNPSSNKPGFEKKYSSNNNISKDKQQGEKLKPSAAYSQSPKRSERAKSPGSRSNSRSPDPARRKHPSDLPPRPKGHVRSGSDPVFGSPHRTESPKVSRRRFGSDKTPVDSPAGSDEYPNNSLDSSHGSNDPTSSRSRITRKKKKRSSDPTVEPEPIIISVETVTGDTSESQYGAKQKSSEEDIIKAFGVVLDHQSKPILKKVNSEPVFNSNRRSSDGDRRIKNNITRQRRGSDKSLPSPHSSDSGPRPSSSSSGLHGYDNDVESSRPNTARARRREKIDQETPRTSRSVDLDKNRKSVDMALKKPKVAQSEDYSRKYRQKREEIEDIPKTKNSSSISGSVSSSSDDEQIEDKVKAKEQKRNEKEMNNFISLLDTTLKMPSKDEEDEAMSRAILNGATYVKGPAPRGYKEPIHKQYHEPGEVPVIEVEEDTLTEESAQHMASKQPEYSYPSGTGDLHVPAGRTMTTTGRLWERITVLRKDCIRGLGVEKLKKAYDILDNIENKEVEPLLIRLLGKDMFEEFAGKIWQLKFCEEAAFGMV